MMDIQLSVSEYQTVPPASVETRPKQVKEWLDGLPLANSLDAGRKLTDAIAALNSIKLAEDTRIKLLDMYRASTQILAPALQQLYAGKPLPLNEKHKQAANLLGELFTELANGYKRALLDLSARRINFGANKLAPLAIARSIELLGAMLDVYYETYRPTPAGVWFELNQLYWYAARQNLHEQAIVEDSKASVNHFFKQVLLIALADPYRLQQGQLAEVKAYLARFGHQAMLQSLGTAENTHGLFLARLDGDKPPKALAHHAGVTDARTDIILNTIPLARTLHQHVQDLDTGTSPKKLGLPEAAKQPSYREMLKRLIKQWGIAPKRVFNRTAAQADLFICSGITSLFHALSQEALPGAPDTDPDVMITLQVSDPMQATGSYQTYNCANWQVLNESAGGVALAKDPTSVSKIKVGDIIGLGPKDTAGLGVAIVRWMQSSTDNQLELGAQMLAPQAEAVVIKPVIAAPDVLFQPALLLPPVPALDQAARMVAARGSFQPMREFEMKSQGATRAVRATRLIEQTDSLDLFFFS
ncbi:MAG: hypothetical protein IV108_00315 [Burkholderiales bacterium]|nr:hypothetical protein [Burkholderiales bacterium]